jgi:hypothetical protein
LSGRGGLFCVRLRAVSPRRIGAAALKQPERQRPMHEAGKMKSNGPTPSFVARLCRCANFSSGPTIGSLRLSLSSLLLRRASPVMKPRSRSPTQNRLRNYALVHRALKMTENASCVDAAAYLRELREATNCSKSKGKRIERRLAERALKMNSERCWRLGVIVSELITDSERHAPQLGRLDSRRTAAPAAVPRLDLRFEHAAIGAERVTSGRML